MLRRVVFPVTHRHPFEASREPEEQELPVRLTETLGILSWKDDNSSRVKEEVRGRGKEPEGDLTFPLFCRLQALVQRLLGEGRSWNHGLLLLLSQVDVLCHFVEERNLCLSYPCVAPESRLLPIPASPLTWSPGLC